jgi:hypothetical protein
MQLIFERPKAMVAAEETEINSATGGSISLLQIVLNFLYVSVSQFNSSSLDWFTAYHTYQEIVDWYYKQLFCMRANITYTINVCVCVFPVLAL